MNASNKHIIQRDVSEAGIWNLMKEIYDPEIPVVSIVDLGIVRSCDLSELSSSEPHVSVTITPTYSGCPAMDVITMNIRMKLLEHGFKKIEVKTILSPAWTTDWMTIEGKEKLAAFGIAPPNQSQSVCTIDSFQEEEVVQCPRCKSYRTKMVSRFGSTACKALYQCIDCNEPFDYFKCH